VANENVGATEHHMAKHAAVYDKGILLPETHHNLVDQLDEVAKAARIAPYWISSVSMTAINCTAAELEYAAGFRQWKDSNVAGAIYFGSLDSFQDRMNAMCGALIRNFINARMVPVKTICTRIKSKQDIEGTAIFIPNFLVGENQYEWADWDKSGFYDWLYQRNMEGKQTILGSKSMKAVKSMFGDSLYEYVANHFMVMT